jgi:hypothetical protein
MGSHSPMLILLVWQAGAITESGQPGLIFAAVPAELT